MMARIGDALISRVEEQMLEIPMSLMTDDPILLERMAGSLPVSMYDAARGTFPLVFQSWLIEVDGLRILVDPCNGNGRRRPGMPHFEGLDLPWLARLRTAGFHPRDIDIVFCTHLHCDHCGWNTHRVNGDWIPTFPNAQYIFVKREYDRWHDLPHHLEDRAPYNEDVFEEAVYPIVAAGLATFVNPPHLISPSMEIVAAPGHTMGHSVLWLNSAGQTACFAGDVLHHPAQIYRSELHLGGCDDLEMAIATRRKIFAQAAIAGSLLFPAHFGHPHYGRVIKSNDDFAFVSGGCR